MASVPIESSFAQILNRTQQNLNRINQRYAPSSVSSQSASLLGGPAASSAGVSLIGAGSSADGPGLLRERLAGKDLTNRPGPKAALNTVTINEDILRDILERLTTLESKRSEDHGVLQRVERLEKLLSNHDSALDHLTYESKDVQRQTTHLQSRISSMEMLYEANKTEAETRRAANAKIDHWIKDQDHWRDDVDRLTTQLRRELSDFKLEKQDVQQRWQQAATKHDVDQVKDKVHLLTQQSISVAISAWTENADNKLKNLEKELALLKIGQSSAVQREIRAKTGDLLRDADDDSDADVARGASQVTAEMIAKALDTPTPSETLVKGMVASEMLQLQTSLEAKMDRQLQQTLSTALGETKRALASQFEQQILAIGLMEAVGPAAFDLPLGPPSTGGAAGGYSSSAAGDGDADIARLRREFDRRVMAGKSKLDQLEKALQDRVTNLSETLFRLQNAYETSDKSQTAALTLLQQRLEAVVHQNESLLQTSLSRSQHHEQLLHQLEEKQSQQLQTKGEELYQRFQETSQELQETRLLLERRLLPLEQSARDWLHELRHQQERILASVTSHPSFVEATRLASSVDGLSKELRDTAANVLKLQAQVAWHKDVSALSDKLSRMDHIVHQKSPEYFQLTTKLLETSQSLTGRMQAVEHSTATLLGETDGHRRRMESAETTSLQTLSRVNVLHEELQLTKQRLEHHEQAYQRDHTALKDLAGSVATRVQSVEGKVHVQQRTQEAEVNALRQHVKLVDDKVLHLDQSVQTVLVNLTFLQNRPPPVAAPAVTVAVPPPPVASPPKPQPHPQPREESFERILTPRRPVPATAATPTPPPAVAATPGATVATFETSPLSDEKAPRATQTPPAAAAATHLVDLIYDHPVAKMATPPPPNAAALDESQSFASDDRDASSAADHRGAFDDHRRDDDDDDDDDDGSSHSDGGHSDDSSDEDDDDVRPAAEAQRARKYFDDDDDEGSVESIGSDRDDDDDESDGGRRAPRGGAPVPSSGRLDDSAASFFSDSVASPAPSRSSAPSIASPARVPVASAAAPQSAVRSVGPARHFHDDVEELDADAFDDGDDSASRASLPSRSSAAGAKPTAAAASPVSPHHAAPWSKPTVWTQSGAGAAPATASALSGSRDDASFSDWDASMDDESLSAAHPPAVTAAAAPPAPAPSNANAPSRSLNNYLDDDEEDEEEDRRDASHSQKDSSLSGEQYRGDRSSSSAGDADNSSLSFDRRQISLDISDSSVDSRPTPPAAPLPTAPAPAAAKAKPGILDGLSDEDSSDLSIDYQQRRARTDTVATTVASAPAAAPSSSTATPTKTSTSSSAAAAPAASRPATAAAPAAKPKILEGLSDEDSSDDSVRQRHVSPPRVAAAASSLPPVPARETPAATTAPVAATAAPVNTAGLSARERLRLRQEQMRAQRSANVSAAPSAVVSGANSPIQAPSSPVTVPASRSKAAQQDNDGVMGFDDDDNSFDD